MAKSSYPSLSLREIHNPCCLGNCNTKDRKEFTEEDICKITLSKSDNFPVRCVGSWAYTKVFRLVMYFGIFAQGMHKKWSGLNYIEICSGPGRCIYRDSKIEADGTALAIINHPKFSLLRSAVFIDYNQQIVDILNKRIQNLSANSNARAVVGSYHEQESIRSILSSLPAGCLNLVLVDPTDCSVPFETIRAIKSELHIADLIINIATYTDAGRNLRRVILSPETYVNAIQKYGEFLGDNNFLRSNPIINAASGGATDEDLRQLFIGKYIESLKSIGYSQFAQPFNVTDDHGHKLYQLLFASGDKKGLEFWNIAKKYDPHGQTELDLGS
jgi:three-Cys-motif partner protein